MSQPDHVNVAVRRRTNSAHPPERCETADNYGIRADYKPRKEALTVEQTPQDYWNKARIKTASEYQYYVYQSAAAILARRTETRRALADVGCGFPIKTHRLLSALANSVTLVDQPTLEGMVRREFPSMAFQAVDLERPSQWDARFDVTICADVIEHLLNPDPCIAFLQRITRRDGVIILSTPEREILRGKNCLVSPKPEHVREWNRTEFAEYLVSRGMKIFAHRLLPEGRLSVWSRLSRVCLGRFFKTRAWFGCQFVLCR